MSISVSIIPVALLCYVVPKLIDIKGIKETIKDTGNTYIHLEEDITHEILNQEFDTNFIDKDTLLKTLIEHGATDIIENSGDISCNCEAFYLEFFKPQDLPYKVFMSYNGNKNIDNFLNDINTEYSANVQEISYNKIKDNLEAQNLEIEEEEILEDNTIVLTINLED